MRLLPLFKIIICICAVVISNPVQAQTIVENQPLRFGNLSLTNNSAARQIVLNTSGGYTADPQYIIFDDPQLANITVSGYLPFITLDVSISDATLTGASPANFTVKNTFTHPTTVVTNISGEATFDVGATLESDGSGTTHSDDTYDGTYSITVTP